MTKPLEETWRKSDGCRIVCVLDPYRNVRTVVADMTWVPPMAMSMESDQDARTYLAAAAPELYRALAAVMAVLDEETVDGRRFAAEGEAFDALATLLVGVMGPAEAALRKARGES